MENIKFKVIPDIFDGGKISSFEGCIKNGKCNFKLSLKLDENCYIKNKTNCTIKIGEFKMSFKIKFIYPDFEPFSDHYYLYFGIEGKTNVQNNWKSLKRNEKTEIYVTPFNYHNIEILLKNIKNNENVALHEIDQTGNIKASKKYCKKYQAGFFSTDYPTFSITYKNVWYPLIKNERLLRDYEELYFDDYNWKEIKAQFLANNEKFLEKIKKIQNSYNEIQALEEYSEPNRSDSFYKDCEYIIKKNIISIVNSFKDKIIRNHNDYYNQTDITFDILCYYIIMQQGSEKIYHLHKSLPDSIKNYLSSDYNNYINCIKMNAKFEKDLNLYNYLLKLYNKFIVQEKQIKVTDKKIIIFVPNILEEQKKLLFNYYSINLNENFETTPKILLNYERLIKESKKQKSKEIVSNKFLIIGNNCKPVNFDEKPKLDKEIEEPFKLNIDNSINIYLPDINLSDYKDHISLSGYCDLFYKFIICSRILPVYIQIANISKNEENKKKAKNYFEILFSVNKKKILNDNSFISEKSNEFVISFEDMIVKLKDAGIIFPKIIELNSIKKTINKNSFIKLPEKMEPIKRKDEWENKKLAEQKREQETQKILNKKIEINNLKSDNLRNIDLNDLNLSTIKQNEEQVNSISMEASLLNNIQKIDIEGRELKFDDLLDDLNKDDDISLFDIDFSDDKKKEEQKIVFLSSEINKENIINTTTKENFESLEKKFNEDFILKCVINKMKNIVNENDLILEYELLKSGIQGYVPNKENLYHIIDSQLKPDEKLQISDIIENSRYLTSSIMAKVSQINYNDGAEEIMFDKIEANILIDLARTISNENRFFNMLMICGLATALFYLNIPYSLFLIGDSNMKVRIKSVDEPHSELILQKLYDCCFIKRNLTELATCLKYLIDNYPAKDESINRVYYIFTDGFDYELKKYKAWQAKIFNDKKNSFSFIITKSYVLEKPSNIEYKNI